MAIDIASKRNAEQVESFSDLKRYVRVRRVIEDKFVEFDFAIGDPSTYVELALPQAAFDVFCLSNKAEIMTEEQAAAVDADMEKWRYGDMAKKS